MRGWRGFAVVVVVTGCYAGHPQPGAPCTPSLGNCPLPQTCELVGGAYTCVEHTAGDAAVPMIDAPPLDARPPDAVVGPMPDAPPDAMAIAPWALVQTAGAESSHVTLAATGAGDLIVVAIETDRSDSSVLSVTDTAGNTYVAVPGARSTNAGGNWGLELWYAQASQPGATQLTVATTVAPADALVVWEVSGIRTDTPLASAAALDDRPASTTPVGAPITTTASGELVIAAVIVDNMISGIHTGSSFTNDRTTNGNGFAHLTDAMAPPGTYQAHWDQPTAGVYCASSAAFFAGP